MWNRNKTSLSMEYKIHNLRYDDLIMRDMGEDYISLHFDLEMNGKWYWDIVSFEFIWRFVKQRDMPEAKYFDFVRDGIKGFGPKHSKMFDKFIEDGFDFTALTRLYLDWLFAEKGTEYLEYRRYKSPEEVTEKDVIEHKKIATIAKDLEKTALSLRDINLRQTELEDKLLDFLNDEALRLFPEIFNSNREFITEFKDVIYSHHVREVVVDIVNLAYRAYNMDEEE